MLAVIILAAGKGTRMKSPLPKVLHLLAGEPLIVHVLETALNLNPQKILLVVGHKAHLVKEKVKAYAVELVPQKEQLGTGHAVLICQDALKDFSGAVLVLCGDVPLLSPETLKGLLSLHFTEKATVTLLTAELDDPTGYGRIIRDTAGEVVKIVEEKDASSHEKEVREVNAGTYVFEKDFLFWALPQLSPANVQKEYYLTDVIALAQRAGKKVVAFKTPFKEEILGINSQRELARVENLFQQRLRAKFMAEGVSFLQPETVYLERRVKLAPGVVIYPMVTLRGNTSLAEGVVVESHCDLKDVTVGPWAKIRAGSILEGMVIPPATVWPK